MTRLASILSAVTAPSTEEWDRALAHRPLVLDSFGAVRPICTPWKSEFRTAQTAWETLVARDLIPMTWASDPRRAFACLHCLGTGVVNELSCGACGGVCRKPYPNTYTAVESVVRECRTMLQAEALLPQAFTDYHALGLPGELPTIERFEWIGVENDERWLPSGPLVQVNVAPVNLSKELGKKLKRQGARPPWQITLECSGQVRAATMRAGRAENTVSIVSWLNQPLFTLWMVLHLRVVDIERGTARITYPIDRRALTISM